MTRLRGKIGTFAALALIGVLALFAAPALASASPADTGASHLESLAVGEGGCGASSELGLSEGFDSLAYDSARGVALASSVSEDTFNTTTVLNEGDGRFYTVPGSKLTYFTFTLSANSRVEFWCDSYGDKDAKSGASGWFTLYDSSGVSLDIVQDGDRQVSKSDSFWALPAGSYTVEYLPYGSSEHRIMLYYRADEQVVGHSVPSCYVPSGEYRNVERAASIPLNREVFGTHYWGFAETMNNVLVDGKYYKFTLSEKSRVELKADILYGVALLAMVDSEGNTVKHPVTGKELIGRSEGPGGINSITVDCGTWPPGTYYMLLYTNDSSIWGSPYTVEVVTRLADPFMDTPASAWYVKQGALDYVVKNGIMSGYTDASGEPTGKFGPNDPITRGQVAVILHRMAGEPEASGTAPFTDVKAGKYYAEAIAWAYEEGIVSGYKDAAGSLTGRFGPNDEVTREQLAKMLGGYALRCGVDVSSDYEQAMAIEGWNKVSEYAKPWIGWAVDEGIMSGKTQKDGSSNLDPKGRATRAEAAKMIMVLDRDVIKNV